MGQPHVQPSRRAARLPASPIRRLAPLAEAARARGVRIHHLNIGQPDLAPPPSVVDWLGQASQEHLAYAPSRGLPDVVRAWQAYYRGHGVEVEPDDILVTAGASEALSLALLTTCDPGDDLLVPEPFYAPYKGLAAISGLNIVPVPFEDGFQPPSIETLERHLTERTRAILICSPNNPTGTVFTADELAGLGGFAQRHGLFILADETYREIVFDGPAAPSALSIPGLDDHVVVIDSLSKRFNVCGVRIGSLTSRNGDVMAAAMELAELRLAVPVIDQRAMIAALKARNPYVDELVATYRDRVDAVVTALAAIPGVRSFRPGGAFYVVAALPVDDAERFSAWLLGHFEHDGESVMLTPMRDFYATPERGKLEVRIACVNDVDNLVRAVTIVGLGLERYPGRQSGPTQIGPAEPLRHQDAAV